MLVGEPEPQATARGAASKAAASTAAIAMERVSASDKAGLAPRPVNVELAKLIEVNRD